MLRALSCLALLAAGAARLAAAAGATDSAVQQQEELLPLLPAGRLTLLPWVSSSALPHPSPHGAGSLGRLPAVATFRLPYLPE